jgi:hypothetical protein
MPLDMLVLLCVIFGSVAVFSGVGAWCTRRFRKRNSWPKELAFLVVSFEVMMWVNAVGCLGSVVVFLLIWAPTT